MKRILKVALALIRDNKVLMAKNYDFDKYFIPGGKIEKNENEEEALIREIKEELNVDLIKDSINYFGTFEDVASTHLDSTVQVKLYFGEISGELKPNSEVEKLAWFGKKDDWEKLGTVAKTKIMPALVQKGLIR
jgi:8-oxo-dGTP pyrophosphatase MutT (NUDIX family)